LSPASAELPIAVDLFPTTEDAPTATLLPLLAAATLASLPISTPPLPVDNKAAVPLPIITL